MKAGRNSNHERCVTDDGKATTGQVPMLQDSHLEAQILFQYYKAMSSRLRKDREELTVLIRQRSPAQVSRMEKVRNLG